MSVSHEIWAACREDYVRGRGSLATVATRHGLKKASVEKCARREGWTALRRDFEAAQLATLIPPPPPVLPPVPIAPDGNISSEWLVQRQELYYRENAALLDKTRKLLASKLTEANDLGADGLAKLTSALGGIVDAENKLLGLRDRRPDKRRPYPKPAPIVAIAEPNPGSEPMPS